LSGELVFVVVLNWNGGDDTAACLETLRPQASESVRLLLVDNGSTDGSPDRLAQRFPDVPMIRNAENLGWAGGNNVGIRHALDAGATAVILANNDTEFAPDAVATLQRYARALPRTLLHPTIRYPDGDEQLGASTLSGTPDSVDGLPMIPMDWVYGACLYVPAEAFGEVGLLDERFFLQMEETDFYRRCARRGWRSASGITSRIVHHESRAFGGRSTAPKTYYMVRNALLLTEKHERSPRGAKERIRNLYWTAADLYAKRTGVQGASALRVAAWVARAHVPFAIAFRSGLKHYLLRRFGPMPADTMSALVAAAGQVVQTR